MQNLQITRGLLRRRLPCHCIHVATFKHARRLIQPAMQQTGVSTLSSFEAHAYYVCRVGKYWANGNGKATKRDGQLLPTNGSPLSLASINERVHNALLCPFNYSRRSILANLNQSWSAPLSFSIRTIKRFYHR